MAHAELPTPTRCQTSVRRWDRSCRASTRVVSERSHSASRAVGPCVPFAGSAGPLDGPGASAAMSAVSSSGRYAPGGRSVRIGTTRQRPPARAGDRERAWSSPAERDHFDARRPTRPPRTGRRRPRARAAGTRNNHSPRRLGRRVVAQRLHRRSRPRRRRSSAASAACGRRRGSGSKSATSSATSPPVIRASAREREVQR